MEESLKARVEKGHQKNARRHADDGADQIIGEPDSGGAGDEVYQRKG